MSRTIIWACLGLILAGAEVMTGTFVLLFFGIGALAVAGLRLAGLDHLNYEIATFGVLSAVLVLGFRKKLQASFEARKGWDSEQTFTLNVDLPVGPDVQIQYQGTTWPAINDGPETLRAGSRVKVARKEGIKLFIVKA